MASSVIVSQNSTHTDYLMTFEAFPPPDKSPIITMVKISVSDNGMETKWRRQISNLCESAPFISQWGSYYVTSNRHIYNGRNVICFIGMKEDESTLSKPIYLDPALDLFGWPSIYTDSDDNLWLAAEHQATGAVKVFNLELNLIKIIY
ncbi:MAG: hypothetical protein GF364_15700 [Candidatus Lokiarchaeota archaeon]|nr:hypothetical protein [Candidatus Lokiarchaeota archaeon]